MAYLLDANVFISGKRLHYGFDFCPGFWDWLVRANQAGRVYCVEKVADELTGSGDDLSQWFRQYEARFSVPVDQSVLPAFATISSWVTAQNYTPDARSQFFQVADYYLVAQALAGSHTVVTHEVPSGTPKKVKIPDVCVGLRIPCISPFEMLRREQARFVLG